MLNCEYRQPHRWASIGVLVLLPLVHPCEAVAKPVIYPCHEARIIGLLDPYGVERDIVPGWRCSGMSISDPIDITLRRGEDWIDVMLHEPGWTGEAAYRSSNFRIAVRGASAVTAGELAQVGKAVAAVIASNDRRTVWYETGYSPFRIDQPPPCVSSKYLLLVGLLLAAVAAIAAHGCLFPRRRDAELKEPLPALPPSEWRVLAGLTVIAAIAFLLPSYLRYTNYGIKSADMGIYTHSFWNALHGQGLFNSPEGLDHLSSHASPGLYLLLPLYALAPHPLTLLVLNGIALVSGTIPAYLIARRRLGAMASVLCAAAYLLNPALASLNYDVHEITFAVPLFMWALLFLQCRRGGLMLLTLALAMLWKENVGISACFVGAYATFVQRRFHLGLAVMLLGIAWVVAGINLVIPYFGGNHAADTMLRYAALAHDWSGLVLSPFLRPVTFFGTLFSASTAAYLRNVLGPFGFLSLLAPADLFLAIPPLAENILDGDGAMRSGQYHYEALLLPVLYVAFVGGVARLSALVVGSPAPATGYMSAGRAQIFLLVLILASQPLHRSAGRGFLLDIDGDSARAEIDAIVAQVPAGASVISPQNIQPHLSDRTVSAYFHEVADLSGDYPPFEYAVLPVGTQPPPPQYEVVRQGSAYSLFRLRKEPA